VVTVPPAPPLLVSPPLPLLGAPPLLETPPALEAPPLLAALPALVFCPPLVRELVVASPLLVILAEDDEFAAVVEPEAPVFDVPPEVVEWVVLDADVGLDEPVSPAPVPTLVSAPSSALEHAEARTSRLAPTREVHREFDSCAMLIEGSGRSSPCRRSTGISRGRSLEHTKPR
jgi:hypothetical protein